MGPATLKSFEIPRCFCGLPAAIIHPPQRNTSAHSRPKYQRTSNNNNNNNNNNHSNSSLYSNAVPDRPSDPLPSTNFFRTATPVLSDTTTTIPPTSAAKGDAFNSLNWSSSPSSSSSRSTAAAGHLTTTPPNVTTTTTTTTNTTTTTTTTTTSSTTTTMVNSQHHFKKNVYGPNVHTSNWVYECHFTPQQQGMNPPEPCPKCALDERRANGEPATEVVFEISRSPSRRMWSTTCADTESGWGPVDETKSLKDYYNPSNIHNVVEPTSPVPTWGSSYESTAPPSGDSLPFISSSEREKKPPSTVSVCGFHMHAIEWHTLQEMKDQEDSDLMIALARRAECPTFNLSVIRWLKVGLNTLDLQPFNDVNCFCNVPMVVVSSMRVMPPNQPQEYDLVCANRDVRTRTTKMTQGMQSCSRIAPIHKVRYPARQTPVHDGVIPSDLWLQRVFGQDLPPELYFVASPESVTDQRPRSILQSNRVSFDFSKPPRPPSPSSASSWNYFSPHQYLPTRKNLSFRVPIEEHIMDGHLQNSNNGGDYHRWSQNLWSSARWSENVYGSAMSLPDALAVLKGQIPYEKTIVHLSKFGTTKLAPLTVEIHLDRATEVLILWNDRQEADDQFAIAEMTDAARSNEESIQQVREEHAALVLQLKEMEQNASIMSKIKCKVCFEGILTDFLLPCGHMALCKDCLRQVTVCPICRRPLTGKQRISWGSKIGGAELALRERKGET